MKKNFIKMNNNQKELSLGNFCRIVKELSKNKGFANQTEIFYVLFDTSDVSDSTINNYCIGYRSIGVNFREKYVAYKKNYEKNPEVFSNIIMGLMSILDGEIYNNLSFSDLYLKVNKHVLFNKLVLELYNLAKNDKTVNDEFTKKICSMIENGRLYDSLCNFLIYIVLEKKQPVYTENSQKEIIEGILNKTNISVIELEKFLKLQMQDGINYTHSLKMLSKEKNPYACFEMGEMEYKGTMAGYPRYVKAYEYLKEAASKNHPRACWLIAQMFYQRKIGNLSLEDKKEAYNYLLQAENVGSVAAINTLGIAYLNGYIPGEDKSEDKAILYFKKAMASDYVYAYNNLGKIYEKKGLLKEAFECYQFGALKGESWSSNKIGEFYRKGLYVDKDYRKAFDYYSLAIDVPISLLNYWAYFNLAKYFYLDGCVTAGVEKDLSLAIKYFEIASNGGIVEALEELIYIYIDKYASGDEMYFNKINECLSKLANSDYDVSNIKNKLEKLKERHLAIVKCI